MKSRRIATATTKSLGAGGYLFCFLQWLWVAILFLPMLLRAGFMKQFVVAPTPPTVVVGPPAELSTAGLIFVVVVVVVMVLVTIYVCLKIPATIGKTGSKIAHQATNRALPVITRHKKLPLKKRLQLTARLLLITKLVLCLLPFGLIFLTDNSDANLDQTVVIIIGATTALGSLTMFGLQAAAAKLLGVDYKQSW